MPIESSTVTNCGPPACASTSVRPRHGRMSAVSPVTRCPRCSFVETCTVRRQRRSAAAVRSVSGAAERKLPPMAKKTRARPSSIAWMAADGVEAVRARRLEAELACPSRVEPRVGHLLPDAHRAVALHVGVAAHRARARAGLADHPAQQQEVDDGLHVVDRVDVLGEPHGPASRWSRATRWPRARPRASPPRARRSTPRARPTRAPRGASTSASKPSVCSATKARSTTRPGARASSSSIAFITPWKNATSPLMRTGTCMRASGVASPEQRRGGSAGGRSASCPPRPAG